MIRKMQVGKCPLASTLEAVPIPEIRIGNALNLRVYSSCFPAIPMIFILPSFSFIVYIVYCQPYHTEKHREHCIPYEPRLATLPFAKCPNISVTSLKRTSFCCCCFSRYVVSDASVTLWNCGPGSFVHGVFQARLLEWAAISFSGGVFSTPGSNLCLLHWQEHSLPLSHKGSPKRTYLHCKVKTRNPVHTGILKQRQPTKTYRELCSMVCGSLDGRGVWGRIDTCKCMAESLCYAPETITTLLISYTQIESLKV